MKHPKPSRCYYCYYSTRLLCPHCKDSHKIIKGSELEGGYVMKCPRFVPDSLTLAQFSKLLGVSSDYVKRRSWDQLVPLVTEKGWRISPILDTDTGRICYVVKSFPREIVQK